MGNSQAIQGEADIKIIVDIHNDVRRSVDPTAANMRKMEWSDCLAEASHDFLTQCQDIPTVQQVAAAKNCEASDQDVRFSVLFATQPKTDFGPVVLDWASGQLTYSHETNQCEETENCDEYKRMIFPESFLVGCATFDQNDCGRIDYNVLCSYAKRDGSYEQPYTLGDTCSECIAPWDNCNDGLCTINDGSSLFPSKTSYVIMFAIVFIFLL